jgi:nucleotide-binding universal stress UspA family protein
MALDTILLAVGTLDTVRATDLAAATWQLAEPADSRIVIGHAFTESEYENRREALGFEQRLGDVDPDEVAGRRPPVPELVDWFETRDKPVEVRGIVGDHGPAIVELARTIDADQVVVGGRNRSSAAKAVFGSTSQEIMQSAPCPVTYVGDREVLE